MKSTILLFATCLLTAMACQERDLGPLVKNGQKPGQLTNIQVENQHGGATISYTLPDDQDLLYVVAEYKLGQGETNIVKSSVFTNSVVLEGFVSTEERPVTLYTVNRSEQRSDPMQVTIKPLISPLELTYASLEALPDFGGVGVNFVNEEENEYVLYILTKDESENWQVHDRLYSSAKERSYTSRGLPAEPQDFAFFFLDKWQNRSDTLFKAMTPLYEEELDKSLWTHYLLDNDNYVPLYTNRALSNLWDGTNQNFMMGPYPGIELPVWFTVDLGQTAVLGRMKMYAINSSQSNYQWFYSSGTPRIFEIWGSNDPALDGSWDSWTLLDRFESIKPSGLPTGQNSAEDIAAGLAGEDHKFSNYDNAYRYIRFKIINTWGSRPDFMLQELTFWGEPKTGG
ncbi:DUF5000 domain-containing lipoprotein [Parapedobacter sp. 10938]|uniref:DUF5000 domain-containing lipoprotein n=1 Tax=Parapedobacter flavus TaxID=3110225 RepID=UPI002DB94216|nr:DUF5000 domain-containing lipoprotein [Parapedobacter sp. 10938]MEC3880442.1 DUF5000 domain-containing lipoprotein [Parapedobacter sp. 10938]